MCSNLPEDEFPNQLSSVDIRIAQELRHRNNLWRSNYHEASIYIEEGLNNDKFENHPRKRATLAATTVNSYVNNQQSQVQTDHNHTPLCVQQKPLGQSAIQSRGNNNSSYMLGDLIASIVLLLLALVEPPAVEGYERNPNVHAAIEMFALGIIAIELLLKFRWMGPRRFFHHGRTVTKLVVLLLMNVEAIVVFLRHSTHPRYSRALRPIFLIDNHYCHGIRRAIRQIFQSLPPILDMFTLALFFMFVFSIFGFYLFATSNTYFSDMPATVGNLLNLATTANLPDIMMPSYAASRWSTIFFVLFIIVHLFLLTNLTMAAVYESFTRKEKEKFHKLLLHRRKACKEAFKLLVSRRQPNRIQYRQFMGLMRYLNRKCFMFDAYLIFKALDTDKNGSISLEEFYQIYDFINLEWKLIYPETKWYDNCDLMPKSFKYALGLIQQSLSHRYFEWTIDILIAAAALLQFTEAAGFEFVKNTKTNMNQTFAINPVDDELIDLTQTNLRPDTISTTIFICVFTVEAILRCLAKGLSEYWSDRWNRFDLFVILVSISGLLVGYFDGPPFGWVVVLRVMRLMRLFEFKRRYKDMWQTLTYILLKRFVSMTCVVMILYYFFAIIGMELLGQYDLRNCCKNTSLESQFNFDLNNTDSPRYYLNDFGDLIASYLTLFSMSSNTYWLATMSAYAIVSENNWTRLFFGFYYLCSIIVMNIVIAFILESFLFRIHYRSKMGNNCDDTNLFTVRVTLSSSEIDFLRKNFNPYNNDKNFNKMIKTITRKKLIESDCCNLKESKHDIDKDLHCDGSNYDSADEKVSLLGGTSIAKTMGKKARKDDPSSPCNNSHLVSNQDSDSSYGQQQHHQSSKHHHQQRQHSKADKRYYLIYQAEQIRNKFSFTMKMYADEVEGWLAEAERADQDEMSAMISRNQIRAEHVAMARLVRRNMAANSQGAEGHLLNWPRSRSYSSSGGGLLGERQQRVNNQSGSNNEGLNIDDERIDL